MAQFCRLSVLIVFFTVVFAALTSSAQTFSDDFENAQLVTDSFINIVDNNENASLQASEPKILHKPGGHSVWIAWQAPDNGLATLATIGSSFDTLLGVYTLEPGNDSPFDRLESVVANDDFAGDFTSQVQFGANSNQVYYIVVDGFDGAAGDINFDLSFLTSTNFQPTIQSGAADRALRIGDPLILTVNFIPTTSRLDFKWFLNGNPLNDAEKATLVIPSLQTTNLGFYTLRFELNDDIFFSAPIEIQVNSEGQQNTLARYKIADAAISGLKPSVAANVNIGYNGTQIYNTTNAIVDPTAPLICGVPPGATYWFSYTAPTNGLMTVDTSGSAIPTLLAAYTYNGTLVSYTNLISLACDNNSGGTGTNTSTQIQFSVTNNRNYFIVVGGVNGARGIVHLNYSLAAGVAASAPVITAAPQGMTVSAGTPVAFSTTASGSGVLGYQWWKNYSKLRTQTNASLFFLQPAASDTGNYFVVVSNYLGSVTSAPAAMTVISSTAMKMDSASGLLVTAFPATRGYQYRADCSATLGQNAWVNFAAKFPDYGGVLWLTNSTRSNDCLFLRVHTP